MHVRLVTQPFGDTDNLHDFIREVAGAGFARLTVIVAWAKRSGLDRVGEHIEELRSNGGHTQLIVGIDEGGATSQGLELALELFDTVYVFHDRQARTFHPKVYAAVGDTRARVFVGSNNLTAGGVFYNYEAAVACDLDLKVDDDVTFLDEIDSYVQRLIADEAVCLELTPELLDRLSSDGRYRIADEDHSRRVSTGDAPASPDSDVDLEDDLGASVFGRSTEAKRSAPTSRTARLQRTSVVDRPDVRQASTTSQQQNSESPVIRRWYKLMRPSDAQHPPAPGSNVTGVLRLVQAGHGIDQTTYFRYEFFGGLGWSSRTTRGGELEEVSVDFMVTIDGASHGIKRLRVDYGAYREAGQHNHTTVLHWDELAPILSQANYSGYYIILAAHEDGTFSLRISPDLLATESFVP